ncbi:Golgi membrane exchange factor (Ric1p-Rgp1p) subunit [Paramarasmius palmivorus]|uniref:Golgi membrane exchange factor (Ric1p-Rgp1p) subunit n=1 Tax=Paramarasmius palmivorus TaxID=297713 RepID=A0AAW0D4U8_9AGAR
MSVLNSDDECPIRVRVTPSQQAYFAGEPFSVVITFTNTRSASAQPPTAGPSRGHKRNAHSISSAPIALPPTSPAGQPRTPTTAVSAYGGGGQGTQSIRNREGKVKIVRRGLIGKNLGPKGTEELPDLIEQRRKRLLAKSLSLTINPGDLEAEIGAGVLRSAGHDRTRFAPEEQPPPSPGIPSSLSRSESLSLASNHPHARKQSVLDGSMPLFTTTTTTTTTSSLPAKSPLSISMSAPAVASADVSGPTNSNFNQTPSAPSSVPPSPSTPAASTSASTSTFSLALDPIEERSPSSPYTPSPSSPFPPSQSLQYATYPYSYPYQYPSAPGTPSMAAMPSPSISIQSPSPQRQGDGLDDRLLGPGIGLGRPPDRDKGNKPAPLTNPSESTNSIVKGKGKEPLKPNTEVILYSYVQLKGSVVITPLSTSIIPQSNSQQHQSLQPSMPPLPPPNAVLSLLRTTLLRGSVSAIGGGSMDIGSSISGSISAGSIPASLSSPSLGGIPRHRRSPSLAGLVLTGFGFGATPATSTQGQLQGEHNGAEAPKGPTPLDAVPRRGETHRRTASARPAPLAEQGPGHVRSSSSAGLWTSLWGATTPNGTNDESQFGPRTPVSHENEDSTDDDIVSPLQTIPKNGLPLPNRSRSTSAGAAPTSTSGWPASHPYGQPPSTPSSSSFSRLFGWSSTSSLNAPSMTTSTSTPTSASASTPLLSSSSSSKSWWDKGGKDNRLASTSGWRSVIGFDSRGLVEKEVDPETPLPTFEVQPTMLGVDLTLGPGESRSYRYTLQLPDNLPPTFLGQQIRFAYELVVGTCRADGGKFGGSNSIIGRPPSPYELLWPALLRAKRRQSNTRSFGRIRGHRRGGTAVIPRGKSHDESEGKVEEIDGDMKSPIIASPKLVTGVTKTQGEAENKLQDLKEYATKLLSGVPTKSSTGLFEKEEAEKGLGDVSAAPSSGRMGVYRKSSVILGDDEDEDGSDEGEGIGRMIRCGEAVEIMTRTQKKVSFDMQKGDVKVAVFTLTKSAFRLGETVLGVVEVNERCSRSRVLQLSARLETHENLPATISIPLTATSKQQLKHVHAEHHTNFVLGTLRTTFSLDIPSHASPAFEVRVGEDESSPLHINVNGNVVPSTAPASVANFPSSPSLPSTTLPNSPIWPWADTGKAGGLEWKVRLSLLVAIASETADTGTEGVRFKSLVRDGPRGEWASTWTAPSGAGVMQKSSRRLGRRDSNSSSEAHSQRTVQSWASYLTSSILGSVEETYHDGDEDSEGYEYSHRDEEEDGYDGIKPDPMGGVGSGVDYAGGSDANWEEVRIETVECEVPIRVWPGNTAFKPSDVVFDV